MNLFKRKSSSSPEPMQGPPPAVQFLDQVFSSFQTNLSNFLQSSQLPFLTVPSPKYPVLARISDAIKAVSPGSPSSSSSSSSSSFDKNSDRSGKSGSFPVMSADVIEERLAGVPVYALSNSSGEFVLVSGSNSRKNLGLVCFSEADAISFLEQLKSMDPSMQSGSQVVPVALNKLVQIKIDGVSFRLIPEASQVKNAIKLNLRYAFYVGNIENYTLFNIQERKMSGTNDNSFPGVPVFQSKSLVLRSQNKRYRPVFFRKEDLEKSLQRASREQNAMNPSLRAGDVEVAVLEDIIQGMKDNSSSQWDDVVFIPPGFDVETGPFGRKRSGTWR